MIRNKEFDNWLLETVYKKIFPDRELISNTEDLLYAYYLGTKEPKIEKPYCESKPEVKITMLPMDDTEKKVEKTNLNLDDIVFELDNMTKKERVALLKVLNDVKDGILPYDNLDTVKLKIIMDYIEGTI